MRYLYGDYETFSDVNLKTNGAHIYVSDGSFEPLILAYAIDDGPVKTYQFDRKNPFKLSDELMQALTDPDVMFVHHGPFDRLVTDIILCRNGLQRFPIERSIDTSVLASAAGLPASLKGAASALELPIRKNPIGMKGIWAFCMDDHGSGRKYPEDRPVLWAQFLEYAVDDAEICRLLRKKLPPLVGEERELFELDQRINDRGIRIDVPAVQALHRLTYCIGHQLDAQMEAITGGQVMGVNKSTQLAKYLGLSSVAEKPLTDNLPTLEGAQKEAARLRLAGAKSSTRKLPAMSRTAHPIDHRSRGCLQFRGTRTGRWAGRAWQPQNLPRESFVAHEVDNLIYNAINREFDDFKELYPETLAAVSMCMRGMVVPKPGYKLLMADYSQIEARLVAWYAGQWDALDVYESGGDIYKEMASAVFSKPVDKITKDERFIGKTLVLSSGYGQGKVRLQSYLDGMGTVVTEDEAGHFTSTFRERWPAIPHFWWSLKEALHTVFEQGGERYHSRGNRAGVQERSGLKFGKLGDSIYIEVATGLRCWFHGCKKVEEPTPWDKTQKHTVIKARNYSTSGSYTYYTITHMIMAENVCSMTARELMARGMLRLDKAGYEIVMTVHDEIVMEVPDAKANADTVDKVIELMCQRPDWGPDIPLAVEAHVASRYGK